MRRVLLLTAALLLGLALCASDGLAGAPGSKRGGKPKAPKGGEGEEGEEEDEAGTVYVLEDSDAVILRDGTRIQGTILCAGQTAVTLLTPDGEKTIPREKIERIIKNTDAGFPKKFKAEENDGHKYLTEAPPDEPGYGQDDGGGPAPKGKRPKGKPKAPRKGTPTTKGTPRTKGTPKTPAKRTPKARPATPKLPNLPGLPNLPNLPGGLPKDPAKLRALLERLKKDGTLNQILKDPRALEAMRKAMRQR